MAEQGVPSDSKRKDFVAKLNQFRGTLPADEQQMLDALVNAARQAHEQSDVSVYWFTSGLSGTSMQAPGQTTNIWSGYGDQGAFPNTPFS